MASRNAERLLAFQVNKFAEKLVSECDILVIPEGKSGDNKRPLIRVYVNGRNMEPKSLLKLNYQ